MFSASGGLRPPNPLTRGSAAGPRWGLCPQTPVIGSCSAVTMVPPTTDPFRRLWRPRSAANADSVVLRAEVGGSTERVVHMSVGMAAFCCCWCFECYLASRMDENMCGPMCGSPFMVALRTNLRNVNGIEVQYAADTLTM